jgi:hypothetical protein
MQEIQDLVLGKIAPQAIEIDRLIELAKRYPNPSCSEYKLIELALNIVLSSYLDQALKHI